MKSSFAFAAFAIVLATTCVQAQASEDWFRQNGSALDAFSSGRDLDDRRCLDVNRAPADRVEQCKANAGPTGSESWFALGNALQDAGDFPSAIHAYTVALGSDSDFRADIYVARGQSFALNGQNDKALEDAATAIDKDKGAGLAGRCMIRAIAGIDLKLALDDCDAALGYVRHNNTQVFEARSLIHFKQGDLKAVLDDCAKALDVNGNLGWALYMSAIAQRGLGNTAVADTQLEATLRAHRFIADIYAHYGVPLNSPTIK